MSYSEIQRSFRMQFTLHYSYQKLYVLNPAHAKERKVTGNTIEDVYRTSEADESHMRREQESNHPVS